MVNWSNTDPLLSGVFIVSAILLIFFGYLFYSIMVYLYFGAKDKAKVLLDIIVIVVIALSISVNANDFSKKCYKLCVKDSNNKSVKVLNFMKAE